jgi:glycosyltransferase involved in cell wall biosynthesis
MRIGIDARLWNETGVGRYIRNLVSELQKIDKKNQYVLFVTPELFASKIFDFIQGKDTKWSIVSTDIRWHSVEEQLLFYKVLENEYLDLVHFPYFSIPVLYNRPYVITIHDLIINHFPTGKASTLPLPLYYIKRFGYQYILKQVSKKANKIITVSEATKKEIIDHLPVSAEKVVVTYEGVDISLQKNVLDKKTLPKLLNNSSYFLFVGNAYPHKNVERLLDAFHILLQKNPDVKLILVGKMNYFYERLQEKVQKMNLQKNVIFTGAVNDIELKALYAQAEALVFPSLMEGFGLPGLEAMQMKCLVLASDIPVFNEIYGEAAVYFDPLVVQDMSDTMQKVLSDKKTFEEIKTNGSALVHTFSWETMAKETLKIYENSISIR